jgi:hypothetical protein
LKYVRHRIRELTQLFLENYYVIRLLFHWTRIKQLRADEGVLYLLGMMGTAMADVPRMLPRSLEEWRAMERQRVQNGYIATLLRYRPRGYKGRVIMLNNEKSGKGDPTLGWADLVGGGIDVYKIPGDHEAYIRRYVKTAAMQLKACLEKVTEHE